MGDGIDAAIYCVECEDHNEEDILEGVSVEAHHNLDHNVAQGHSNSTQQQSRLEMNLNKVQGHLVMYKWFLFTLYPNIAVRMTNRARGTLPVMAR